MWSVQVCRVCGGINQSISVINTKSKCNVCYTKGVLIQGHQKWTTYANAHNLTVTAIYSRGFLAAAKQYFLLSLVLLAIVVDVIVVVLEVFVINLAKRVSNSTPTLHFTRGVQAERGFCEKKSYLDEALGQGLNIMRPSMASDDRSILYSLKKKSRAQQQWRPPYARSTPAVASLLCVESTWPQQISLFSPVWER